MTNTDRQKFIIFLYWYLFAVGIVCGIFLLVNLYDWSIVYESSYNILYAICFTAFLSNFFAIKLFLKKIDVLHPFFLFTIVYICVFCVRPIAILAGYTGYIHEDISLYRREVFLSCAYAFCGIIAFYCGFLFFRQIRVKKILVLDIESYCSIGMIRNISFVCIVAGILLSVYLVYQKGGISDIFANRATIFMGSGYLFNFVNIYIVGWMLILLSWKNKIRSHFYKVVLFVIFLMISIDNFCLTGARGGILLLSYIYAIFYVKYIGNINRFYFFIAVVMLAVVSVGGVLLRGYGAIDYSGAIGFMDKNMVFNQLFRILLPYDGFIKVLEVVPDRINYYYGKTYTDFFVAFIPRSLWPDKPLWGKILFTKEYFGVEDSIFTYSILGEFYLNFGLVGVLFGMFLVGFFLGAIGLLYERCLVCGYNRGGIFLFVFYVFASWSIIWSIRGGLFTGIMGFIIKFSIFIAVVLLLILFGRGRVVFVRV